MANPERFFDLEEVEDRNPEKLFDLDEEDQPDISEFIKSKVQFLLDEGICGTFQQATQKVFLDSPALLRAHARDKLARNFERFVQTNQTDQEYNDGQ